MHRFQELDSDDEKNAASLDPAYQQVSHSTTLNPDELYFNDMDIRAWERRASAFDDGTHRPQYGYQDEDEGYYDEAGESMSHADYEEMLFQRVLDKIRLARAAGNADVQLSPDELDAYQSKLHGERSPAVRSQPSPRPVTSAAINDNASVVSDSASRKHSSSSRSKKTQPRPSIFSSKSKKEKPSSRKRTSTVPGGLGQAPPGFMIPGPDGHPQFAPINAYQGSLVRDVEHFPQPDSRSVSGNSHQDPVSPDPYSPTDILGAFPGSEHTYRPAPQPRHGHQPSARQLAYERDLPPTSRTRSSSIQSARVVPFPIEPYQYHAFSPASSSPTSPSPQYARRVSSGPSEASYTSMPRRVPVPTAAAPVPLQRSAIAPDAQAVQHDPILAAMASGSAMGALGVDQVIGTGKAGVGAKEGERRRKSGKSRKKG